MVGRGRMHLRSLNIRGEIPEGAFDEIPPHSL